MWGRGICLVIVSIRSQDAGSSPPIKLEIIDVEKVKGLSNYYVSEALD